MFITFVVLYRLKMNILGEKYEPDKLEKATKYLSFVDGVLMLVMVFSINSPISAFAGTSQESAIIYIQIFTNLLQGVTILYSIGFHCTPMLSYITDSAKSRRQALLQDMADSMSFDQSEHSGYDYDYDSSDSISSGQFSWSTSGTSNFGGETSSALTMVNTGYKEKEQSTPVMPPPSKVLKRVSFGQDLIQRDTKLLSKGIFRIASDESL